ncbi:hypothetical protein [Campylobacter hyointestinalis]|uniref:hypothetical protein n=1 Tax=Campylobacter hyointestinalis TaxID=198 RepID=UPI000CE4A006|nr:hypothetical protein [Campylobacter hyointestinalis]PPB63558.1 hypothetical protein CDQ74_04060 [Campylobacter hyointestinalis subsp. hyointestinalis]
MAIIKTCGGIVEAHHQDIEWIRQEYKSGIEILRTGVIPEQDKKEVKYVNMTILGLWAIWLVALLICIYTKGNMWFIGALVLSFFFCVSATQLGGAANGDASFWRIARGNGYKADSDNDLIYLANLKLANMYLIPKETVERETKQGRYYKSDKLYEFPIDYEKMYIERHLKEIKNAKVSFKYIDRVRAIVIQDLINDMCLTLGIHKARPYEPFIRYGWDKPFRNTELDANSFGKLFKDKLCLNDCRVGITVFTMKPKNTDKELDRGLYIHISNDKYKDDEALYKGIKDWEVISLKDSRFNPEIYRSLRDDKEFLEALSKGIV